MLNRFNSNTKKLNKIVPVKLNSQNLVKNLDTGSLQNIKAPTNKLNSNTKTNSNPIKLVNNKNIIDNFHHEILENSARYNARHVSEFDIINNKLIIYNVHTDYGTEGANANNFEILVFGLHIPGNYTIADVGNNVVITLGDRYIDFSNTTINDIYVIGKLIDIPLDSEDGYDLQTENDLDLIV